MVNRNLPFYEFNKGVYEIDEFDCVSIFVIVGEERALVLDTGTGIGDLRWVIENRITKKPYDVILTHNHGDHIGGSGFFPKVWIHPADMDWTNPDFGPNLEFRKSYARLIAARENKHYDYDVDTDILPWEKEPVKMQLQDGQVFDLGGRKVTLYHCPGHTAGEMVAIDDLTKTLFLGDACNQNLLLGKGIGSSLLETVKIAEEALQRIYVRKDQYERVYNSHHDFRGFGSSLGEEVLPNAVRCLRTLVEGTAKFKKVPDQLLSDRKEKTVAEYGNVQISCIDSSIDKILL